MPATHDPTRSGAPAPDHELSLDADDSSLRATRRRLLALAGSAAAVALLAPTPRAARADALFDTRTERNALRAADELIALNADFFGRVARFNVTRADGRQSSVLNLVATQDRALLEVFREALRGLQALDAGIFLTPNAQAIPDPRTFQFPTRALESSSGALAFGISMKDLTVSALHGLIGDFQTRSLLEAAASIAGVQGRHAAALREVAGRDPFPQAFEPALNPRQVVDRLSEYGYKGGAAR